jgi:hypothetical protein
MDIVAAVGFMNRCTIEFFIEERSPYWVDVLGFST